MVKLKENIYRNCIYCDSKYLIYRKNQKWCSHECKSQHLKELRDRKCAICQTSLTNLPRGQRYCSKNCLKESQKQRNTRQCKHCGKDFGSQLTSARNDKDLYCSVKCSADDKRGYKSIMWKGGTMIHQRSKEVLVLVQSSNVFKGVRDKYKFRKRLIAELILGRKLLTSECVLHLDNDPQNDNPNNLYICDIGTMRRFKKGSIKITESNLKNYDKFNYIR